MTKEYGCRKAATYKIHIEGVLGPEWSLWFDGFQIQPLGNDETLLVGKVADQPALHGLLVKLWNLGLTIISVEQVI